MTFRSMDIQCSTSGRLEDVRCSHGVFANARPGAVPIVRHPFSQWHKQQAPPQHSSRSAPLSATRASVSASAPAATAEDKWIAQALDALDNSTPAPPQLAGTRSSCLSALSTLRMPTSKNEEYRFTDVTPILQAGVRAPEAPSTEAVAAAVERHHLKQPTAATIVIVDGTVHAGLSTSTSIPEGAYIGGVAGAPADIVSFALGAQSRGRGGPFATVNGAIARDAAVVYVPANVSVVHPIHVLYLSSCEDAPGAARTASAPRLLVVLEDGACAEIIEEFAPLHASASGPSLCAAVAEIELDDRATLKHSYVEIEGQGAAHMKATLVNQGQESDYSLTEARVGGELTRHDLGVDQLGERTQTTLRSFLLAGQGQLHDLHSKLKLDHPEGAAAQLHKCISAHPTSRGVFDGNVRVNRLAQRTDAQQLSRNLLLAPRATVNVKPNLQIIADDVKCTHGCTVSDLEDEELFYLKARGIDTATARQMLVYSFGREVVQGLRDEALLARVEGAVRRSLDATADAWVGSQ